MPLRRRPLSRGIWLTALIAVVWAAVPLIVLGLHVLRHGGVLTGADGALAGADQMLYMDEIRQSAQHVLITDHFDLAIGRPVFVDPLLLITGLVWLAGVSIAATFWLLQLLAAPVLAAGTFAFVARCLSSTRARVLALVLGLFYLSPLVPLLVWTGAVTPFQHFALIFPAGEAMPAWQLWGYPHAAVCMGLLAASLAGACAVADGSDGRRRLVVGVSAAALIVGWLHPWQGATLIAVLTALAVRSRSRAVAQRLLIPILAAAAPMLYEAILARTDAAWRIESASSAVGHVPTWMLLVTVLPLGFVAMTGIRAVPRPMRDALVAWPVAGLAIYFATSTFPYHALQGISIPLAVLAVAAFDRQADRMRRLRAVRWLGAGLATLCVAAGVSFEAVTFADSMRSSVASYWLGRGSRAALAYLDRSRERGGVFAAYHIGMAVPAFTGRRTWLGEWTWTPDFSRRQTLADELIGGRMAPVAARALVAAAGARFVLVECEPPHSLRSLLGPMVVSERRFGCASVYVLRTVRAR
jgi:hypothetical protein